MNFTPDEISSIIGMKELELMALRRENARLQAKLNELAPKEEAPAHDLVD